MAHLHSIRMDVGIALADNGVAFVQPGLQVCAVPFHVQGDSLARLIR